MMNTLCLKCEFGIVRLEVSSTHFQRPVYFCLMMDREVGEIAKCSGFQRYEPDEDDDE